MVEVDRVLKLVGYDGHVKVGTRRKRFDVHVDDLSLVAVRMDVGGERVGGPEVSGRAVELRVEHYEARVAVDARVPDVPECPDHCGPNTTLEDLGGLLQALLVEIHVVLYEPVGVVAHYVESGGDAVGGAVVEVGYPERVLRAL